MKWFGKSWGAPCCEPEDHTDTPVGRHCFRCDELILVGDQGVSTPLVHKDSVITTHEHLECFLRRIRPHGRECPYCRGKERSEHATRCESRQGGMCNCIDIEDL